MIEAIWIFEVPMALPLDARVPEAELQRARKALHRARAVGEEYEGVEVATAMVRARRAGEAIVREAKRRGVEAIVLAAERPSRLRGGLHMGGRQGLHDTYVGDIDPLRRAEGAVPRHPHRRAGGRRGRSHAAGLRSAARRRAAHGPSRRTDRLAGR